MEKVSQNGVITVEESKTAETYSEVVEGMQFDRGYVTPYMVTDNDKMEAVIDDALILITDKKISNIQEILPVLEAVLNAGKKLVIIADDIEGEALATIILNKLRGTFTCVCVKAPGFGDRRKEMLQDIAILTGGQVISTDLGMELKDTTLAQLGRARQVKVTKETTTIVEGAGAKDDIQVRIAHLHRLQRVQAVGGHIGIVFLIGNHYSYLRAAIRQRLKRLGQCPFFLLDRIPRGTVVEHIIIEHPRLSRKLERNAAVARGKECIVCQVRRDLVGVGLRLRVVMHECIGKQQRRST